LTILKNDNIYIESIRFKELGDYKIIKIGGKKVKEIRKIMKCIFVTALLFTTILIGGANGVYASEMPNQDKVDEIAEEYSITIEEIENLEENLDKALEELPTEIEIGETFEIPVSENLVLEISTKDNGLPIVANDLQRATYRRTITSTLSLKNVLGWTVVSLNSVGVFSTDGTKSTPVDAYGTYSSTVWNVSTKKSVKGGATYNAYVRNSFSGKFNIGIDAISMTIQSFSYSCTIYCNAKGTYSSSWV